MITSCELCEKIEKEKHRKELTFQMRLENTAKAFCEDVLAPVIAGLTDIPKNKYIGMVPYGYQPILYQSVSQWEIGKTHFGNPVQRRHLDNELGKIQSLPFSEILDFNEEAVNKYLTDFGFVIKAEFDSITTDIYSTTTTPGRQSVYKLYLTALCPKENE